MTAKEERLKREARDARHQKRIEAGMDYGEESALEDLATGYPEDDVRNLITLVFFLLKQRGIE